MNAHDLIKTAEEASEKSLAAIYSALDRDQSFLLEAGAGAGKTFSLIKALQYLIEKRGDAMLRKHQRIACITYTNVASNEISSRIDGHPVVVSTTIHAFCWSLIRDFQPQLRDHLSKIGKWSERLAEVGGVGDRRISYELGYPKINDDEILLHHNDVLDLTVELMKYPKFCSLFVSRYPILFIDEYQDTNKKFVDALKERFLDTEHGPIIGFFGDHWQKIYGDGCGSIEHQKLVVIGKGANFRSAPAVVDVLNRIRPDLKQMVSDPSIQGDVAVYHTNNWTGQRRTESHWKGDLPPEQAHLYLEAVKLELQRQGWDFTSSDTKILMLTHNILAKEQGYSGIAGAFNGNNERFIKKEDPYIKYFVDTIEPVCEAYQRKSYGEMFDILGRAHPTIRTHADKVQWTKDMDQLLVLRSTGSIGDVIEYIKKTGRFQVPDNIERNEKKLLLKPEDSDSNENEYVAFLKALREVPYEQMVSLTKFINEQTPFSTKHGVKGAEFENVLVVIGRGWNQYNFNQMLEFVQNRKGKQDTFERNRNLFYVACSRSKRRLALLFTQELSNDALSTLESWFGKSNVKAMQN